MKKLVNKPTIKISKPTLAAAWKLPRKSVIAIVRLYQQFSAVLPRHCKYYPSCSQYMIESIRHHGLIIGLFKGSWRLLRCNPFSHGGYDPVVKETANSAKNASFSDDQAAGSSPRSGWKLIKQTAKARFKIL